MKSIFKRLLSIALVVFMVAAMVPASVAAAENVLPKATVTKLKAQTLLEYSVWDGSLSTGVEPLPVEIVMNFKADDSLEECLAGGYAEWLTDFNLTVEGLENGTITADNCYLAGNYGTFGWIVIPTDGIELEDGVTYPVMAGYDASLNYKDICNSVKDFTAAIHIDQAILDANPNMTVSLELVMTNPEDAADKLVIGEPAVYTTQDLDNNKKILPDAAVTVLDPVVLTDYDVWNGSLSTGVEALPLEIVMNFKAQDTLEECLAGGYAEWLTDFNLTVTGMENGSIIADNCYLAGNYGTFGWIVIPTDGMELEEGVTYPVVAAYDATLNYMDICKSVKDFTAAIHIDQAILDANPNLEIKLELVMTNPKDAADKLVIGEPAVYTAEDLKNKELPKATVTVLGKQTLTDYRVWEGEKNLVAGEGEKPVEVVLNFKAQDTLEECLTGGYSKWLTDFYITIDGLAEGSVTGTNSYLAGNYGTYGWIVIPLDEAVVENGVTYPVVANYDPTLNYKDICKSVKDFTAAIHIDQAILDANPDMTVTLELKMTNPEDASDVLLIGEPAVYDVDALNNGASVQNKDTNKVYTSIEKAMAEAAKGETVELLQNVTEEEVVVKRGRTLDLNGYTLTAEDVAVPYTTSHVVDSTNGEGKLYISRDSLAVDENNAQLPLWDEDGFRFVDLAFNQRATMETGSNGDYAYFRFYITGDDATCMLAQQMADGGADNGVTVQIKLSWKNASGEETFRYFVYGDEKIVEYAANWTGNMFYLNVYGVEDVTDLQLTAVAVSSANEDAEVIINGATVTPA